MQTVLGANGQIAEELTRYLHDHVTHDIRLVSRNPGKVHETDQLVKADLMDAEATAAAVADSDIAYLTVGLPIDSALWEQRFPVMMANTIAACRKYDTKLVFFDNTYMYPRTAARQVEDTPFEPAGRKAAVRARIADMLRREMDAGTIDAVICRAPEFYGPGKTKSLTNSAVFDRIKHGKRPLIPLDAHTKRTLIWTPDASRGMGLIGNTPDAYGQTWHLPVDPERLSYADMITVAGQVTGKNIRYTTLPAVAFKIGALVNQSVKEASELLPRYRVDNIFDSAKFAARFPGFTVTTYRQGITEILGG
ncbi:NAD-dependent epimerase/dehydratase family protein [Amycolatopsis sp. SID8362]|uniref:NAD-dependent epimerase/dehydratase family protein n=1 Tax=Amycolatopsis sp. SID8362 TaxID=2690346 RepID=UPI001368D985|nr:NAD-dependent epimerase/dehydratase family protein [Amycolatopsis sp. SID8362]NBH01734.1 NAD-dependent epimerase/dehydratase family protein [Amycolatopsis sp. SID8362]NED38435.1 NAD-dependent epimerase/dehydratase family protein [Amycolatopsis sp. SID8362]